MNLHDWDLTRRAKEEGLVEGSHNKAIESAKNFLKEKVSPEVIARCVGLPLEGIQKLSEEIEKGN